MSETEAAARRGEAELFGKVGGSWILPIKSVRILRCDDLALCRSVASFVLTPRLVIVRHPLFYYVVITLQHKPAPESIRRFA